MNFEVQKWLARLVHAIRDDWDVAGIESALGQAREAGKAGDVRAIVDAAVAAALDHRNRTPAVIPLAGPHWQTRAQAPPTRRFDPRSTCGICSLDEDVCKAIRPKSHDFVPAHVSRREAEAARARRAAGAS